MSTYNYKNFYTIFPKIQNKTGDLSDFADKSPLLLYSSEFSEKDTNVSD